MELTPHQCHASAVPASGAIFSFFTCRDPMPCQCTQLPAAHKTNARFTSLHFSTEGHEAG